MTLLKELKAIEADLKALHAERPPRYSPATSEWTQRRVELSKPVLTALRSFDRYSASDNLMASLGSGAGTIRPEFMLPRLLDVAVERGATFAVHALAHLLSVSSARVMTTCLLWGVSSGKRISLAPGVFLSPLPADPLPEKIEREIRRFPAPLQSRASFSLLSTTYTVSPVVMEGRDHESMSHAGTVAFDFLRDIVTFLCVIGPSPVALEQKWDEFTDPKLAAMFAVERGPIFMQEAPPFPPPAPALLDATAKVHISRYLALSRDLKEKLKSPLNRLNSGMKRRSRADQAIDCGIALEMLLLRESINTEIGYRLALHAGLLLGKTLEERRKWRADVKKLYDFRSSAAHGSPKTPKDSQAIAEAGFAACAAVIREITRRGSFPKWEDLELGAEPPRAA